MKNFKEWFKAASARALRTVFQTALAMVGSTAVFLSDVNWWAVLSASLMAGILSLLTSAAGLPEVKGESENEE